MFFVAKVNMLRKSLVVILSVDAPLTNALLLVIKADSPPTVDDFLGGRFTNEAAQRVVLDFRRGDVIPVTDTLQARGIRHIVRNNGSVSLFILQTDIAALYLALWDGFYESSLCELCKERSDSGAPCGFCLNEPLQCDVDTESTVTVSFDTFSVGCVYWDHAMEGWQSYGCEVRAIGIQTTDASRPI